MRWKKIATTLSSLLQIQLVSDYEEFIHYHWDDDDMVELSPPTVSDSVWDIWEAYLQE